MKHAALVIFINLHHLLAQIKMKVFKPINKNLVHKIVKKK